MECRKIIPIGLIAGFIAFIAGSVLYMNPLVADLYAQNAWVGAKSMDLFGGTMNWLLLMLLGGLVSTLFVTWLYTYTEKGLPVKPAWKKGLFYGFLLWLVVTAPGLYNTWLMYTYPETLLLVEAFNGLVGSLVAGVIIAVLYAKWK